MGGMQRKPPRKSLGDFAYTPWSLTARLPLKSKNNKRDPKRKTNHLVFKTAIIIFQGASENLCCLTSNKKVCFTSDLVTREMCLDQPKNPMGLQRAGPAVNFFWGLQLVTCSSNDPVLRCVTVPILIYTFIYTILGWLTSMSKIKI